MTIWIHSRRGRIEGVIVEENDPWVHIGLTADSPRASTNARGHGPIDPAGTIITVRSEHLTEIRRPSVGQLLDFAAAHPGRHTSNTDMAIRDQLGITPTRYIQLLNDAIRTPEALQHDPTTTNRLLREQSTAAHARARRRHLL